MRSFGVLSSVSTLDLVKLICIKHDRINKLPWWRFITRKELTITKNRALKEFFRRDIFSQSNAIASILGYIHTRTPEIIVPEVHQIVDIGSDHLRFHYKTSNILDSVKRNGFVTYNTSKGEFDVDVEPAVNDNNGYKFVYKQSVELPSKLKTLWDEEILPSLESMYMSLLMYIINILNFPGYTYVREEYINN